MIRVVLAEDQALVRAGVRTLLDATDDLRVVAEAEDGDEALQAVLEHTPDVALIDVRMPRRSGVQVLEELQRRGRTVPALMLTTFDDDVAAFAAIAAGARGFLLKDVSFDQLAAALRTLAGGGTLLSPAVTARVLRGGAGRIVEFPSAELPDPLTPRETEVLRLMASGWSNSEIAQALGCAVGTVKNHASSVLSKLGVRDRTRAVLKALELGLFDH